MSAASSRVLVAMDKFRSTASAHDLATSIVEHDVAHASYDVVALSDGGEGFRAAFVGDVVTVDVRDPWGHVHEAPMTVVRDGDEVRGVIEVAEIIGRSHRVAPNAHEALAASSAGVADAILASSHWGVTRVVVGCGGSATSDGGEGCYDALRQSGGPGVALTAATDIDAEYWGALRYAEQKGVAPGDLEVVRRRLEGLAGRFAAECGRDVVHVARTGAAGGLSGALYALGADLVSGFDEVARANSLADRLATASVVVTGEGRFDAGSLEGKVVAGVCDLTRPDQRVLVVCGSLEEEAGRDVRRRYPWVQVRDLVTWVGERRAFHDTLNAVGEVVARFVAGEL